MTSRSGYSWHCPPVSENCTSDIAIPGIQVKLSDLRQEKVGLWIYRGDPGEFDIHRDDLRLSYLGNPLGNPTIAMNDDLQKSFVEPNSRMTLVSFSFGDVVRTIPSFKWTYVESYADYFTDDILFPELSDDILIGMRIQLKLRDTSNIFIDEIQPCTGK